MDENELRAKLKEINKEHEIVRLAVDIKDIEHISTGAMSLDMATQGGWPMGRVVLLYGHYGSTKTTLAMMAVANAQAKGKSCIWVDAEHRFNKTWAEKWGVDLNKLPVISVENLEHIKDAMEPLLRAGVGEVVVIDSVSSIQTEKYFEEDSSAMGQQSRATKEVVGKVRYWSPGALIICLSQQTTKIENTYTQQVPTGGNYLDHISSITAKLSVPKSDIIRSKEKATGKKIYESDFIAMDVHWNLTKNGFGAQDARGMYRFSPQGGVDNMYEVLKMACLFEVIDVGGKWHKYEGEQYDGFNALYQACIDDGSIYERIKKNVFDRG